MYIFYFESVYSNGFWYWNLKVNRFDLWSILGSLALIPIHHTYYISWYRTLKTLRCCFNMTSRYEPLEFFQVIVYYMLLFFFFRWKLYLPYVWFANVEFVTHFTELKRLKWEKNSWDYYLVFEMSHLVISINSIINFKNIIIFCLI